MAEVDTAGLSQGREKVSWVCCDSCGKWRQVSKLVADSLDENSKWFCSDNPNRTFDTCDAPQELSDDEIDKAVNNTVSQADSSPQQPKALRPAVWQHVSRNIFTHRLRKVEDEDDIMVCQCRPPLDGSPACGENCLNRLLNQECNPDFCPCGSLCSNTQFTRRQYAGIEQRRAGPKGCGLFAKQPVKAGEFIIEYVGEVLEEEEYLRRKLFYQEVGQRHYYFMNVGNGEVIDACRKGGLGRFINHSCDPNCETQKWVVHGELAIGLFALKDVQAGEELTFDYNFERYGDKALKCYCNSKNCRGYIGGTPEEHEIDKDNDENMDASDDPDPIMVAEEDAARNPACQAILANEVGLAPADFRDVTLRKGWEEIAAKYGLSLDWEVISKALPVPADSSVSESGPANGIGISPSHLHAVEQKLKESKIQRRLQPQKPAGPPAGKKRGTMEPPLSPAAAAARQTKQGQMLKGFKRRSEVDRRLDTLVAPSGKLRDASVKGIVRMLRLFNLCDIGGARTAPDPHQPKDEPPSSMELQEDGRLLGTEAAADHLRKRRRLEKGSGDTSPRGSRSPARHGSDHDREEGEIADLREEEHVGDDRDRRGHRAECGRLEPHNEAAQLSARQRSRMADVSLLLEVVLKTSATSTKREFCNCGVLRQLQSVLSRCTGAAYTVIVKKIVRAVEHLPLSAEDMHRHSSAHGSFSDTLWTLGGHSDHEVRHRARALREKYPLEACSKDVQEGARAARAATAARRMRHANGHGPPRRRYSSTLDWREPTSERFQPRSTSTRPRVTKFHNAGETLRSEGEPWVSRIKERESLWSNGPGTMSTQLSNGSRRQAAQTPSLPVPSTSSVPLQHGAKGLHDSHGSNGATNGHHPGSWRSHSSSHGRPYQDRSPLHHTSGYKLSADRLSYSVPYHERSLPASDGANRSTAGGLQHPQQPPMPAPFPTCDSPITPEGSPPPPLPTEPPPSRDTPSASPVTPDLRGTGNAVSPTLQTGAYLEDRASSDDSERLQSSRGAREFAPAANGNSDWKVPSIRGANAPLEAALAAPLPVGGQIGNTAPQAESDGVPSIDDDAGSPSPVDGAQAWDRPGPPFEEFVGRVIAHRLGKYKQPDHPNRISREELTELYKKSSKAIIEAERKAFEERQRLGTFKHIDRFKLEARIKDYVREVIRRHHERRASRS